jgi:imidazoleglycerol-phosphate dehydratase
MATITRKTKETDITSNINIYGKGISNIDTGVGFLDHMLESFSKHSLIDIDLKCDGDIHIDDHHSVEDSAIVLAQSIKKDLFPISNINRFASSTVVMDEAGVECSLDISNRAFLVYDIQLEGKIGTFDTELVEEFFRAFAFNLGITLHIIFKRGKNKHHIVECAFKALALSLRYAMSKNDTVGIPSTKGSL